MIDSLIQMGEEVGSENHLTVTGVTPLITKVDVAHLTG